MNLPSSSILLVVSRTSDLVSRTSDSSIKLLPVLLPLVPPKPPGTSANPISNLADNPKHDPKKKPEVGKPCPDMLRFKLKLINGTYTEPYKFGLRHDPKWDDKGWIRKLNRWRQRILDRMILKDEDPSEKPKVKTGAGSRW